MREYSEIVETTENYRQIIFTLSRKQGIVFYRDRIGTAKCR